MRNSELKIALDTSPLITLCSFRVRGRLAVEYLLSLVDMMVVETVALESTANLAYPDAVSAKNLLDLGHLPKIPTPVVSGDAILDEYTRLGQGERYTIRLGLDMPDVKIILDDHLAFVVACRFGLAPILLLDLLVLLVNEDGLEKQMAVDIVNAVSARYSKPFVKHTLSKLGEVK